MATLTKATINTGLVTTLGAAASVDVAQDLSAITESIFQTPLLQVYPSSWTTDTATETDRTTFGGGIRQTEIVFYADVYAARRNNVGLNMESLIAVSDEIDAILNAQDDLPYFGVTGIKAFSWSAEKVVIEYSQAQYHAVRYTIAIRVF